MCDQCGECPNAKGWGNPSCSGCGGVEDCLPFERHLFRELLRTPVAEEDASPVHDSNESDESEEEDASSDGVSDRDRDSDRECVGEAPTQKMPSEKVDPGKK